MGTDNAPTSDSYPRQNHNVSTDPHIVLDGDGKRALEALVPFFDRKGMLGGIHATTRADEHMVANGYRRAVHQIRTPIDKGPLTYTAVVSVINIKWRKNRCSLQTVNFPKYTLFNLIQIHEFSPFQICLKRNIRIKTALIKKGQFSKINLPIYII